MSDDIITTDNGLHRDLDEILFHKARSLEGVVRRKVDYIRHLEDHVIAKRNNRIKRLVEHLDNLRTRIIAYKEEIAALKAQISRLEAQAIEKAIGL